MSHKKRSSFVPPTSIFYEEDEQEPATQNIKSASHEVLKEVRALPPAEQKVVKEKWLKRADEHRAHSVTMRDQARFNEATRQERMADFYKFAADQIDVGA